MCHIQPRCRCILEGREMKVNQAAFSVQKNPLCKTPKTLLVNQTLFLFFYFQNTQNNVYERKGSVGGKHHSFITNTYVHLQTPAHTYTYKSKQHFKLFSLVRPSVYRMISFRSLGKSSIRGCQMSRKILSLPFNLALSLSKGKTS